MRQMIDVEVKTRADMLTKRHRSELCRMVYDSSKGRTIREVAKLLGRKPEWVEEQLKRYAVESASGDQKEIKPTIKHP